MRPVDRDRSVIPIAVHANVPLHAAASVFLVPLSFLMTAMVGFLKRMLRAPRTYAHLNAIWTKTVRVVSTATLISHVGQAAEWSRALALLTRLATLTSGCVSLFSVKSQRSVRTTNFATGFADSVWMSVRRTCPSAHFQTCATSLLVRRKRDDPRSAVK